MRKVVCLGVWDMFHAGHLRLIQRAAALGELTVCVVADAAVTRQKGHGRPVVTESDRLAIVSAMRDVRRAIIVPDFEITQQMIDQHDTVVVGEDQSHVRNINAIPSHKKVMLTRTDGVSTSQIVQRLQEKK